MIAASHIGTTSATHTANSSASGARQSSDSQSSFSDSLNAASQANHTHNTVDHQGGSSTGSKHQKESDADTKTQTKRTDGKADMAPATAVQAANTDISHVAIALPTHIFFPSSTNIVSDEKSVSASSTAAAIDSADSTAAANQSSQVNSWTALNGAPSWSSTNLSTSQSTDETEADVDAGDAAHDSQAGFVSAAGAPTAQQVTNGGAHDTKVAVGPTATSLVDAQSGQPTTTDSPQDNAVASQIAATVAVNQQTNAIPFSNATSTSFKANNALKGLQGLTNTAKSTNSVSNPQVAGAKETDSYLSIQKNAKSDVSTSKDATIASVQHGVKDSQTQEQVATPVVVAQNNHIPVSFEMHQQKFTAEIATDAPSASAQDAAAQSLEAQANHAVATAQTATSELSSAVVNSAKLIQSISQSEMRVGMRTADFGDISIRTSSTRDSLSAQISLAHGDLAQTLSTHMPEMQTRLSSGETVDVQIHHDGQASDFSSNAGGNGNQNGSQSQAQNESAGSSNLFGNSYSSRETAVTAVPSAVIAAQTSAAGRLDIRA